MTSPNIPEWFSTTVETDLDVNDDDDSNNYFEHDPDSLEIVEDMESLVKILEIALFKGFIYRKMMTELTLMCLMIC